MTLVETIAGALARGGSVRSVFGDPVVAEGRTVIPVARVTYGFGGGSGEPRQRAPQEGGGGGLIATPLGVIEISRNGTRFLPLRDSRAAVLIFACGTLAGLLAWRALGRRWTTVSTP